MVFVDSLSHSFLSNFPFLGQISATSRPCWNLVWFTTLHGSRDNATSKIWCKGEIYSSLLIGNHNYLMSHFPTNLELNTQADLWSVGAILFQLVTGRTPFTGNNQIQVQLQNLSLFRFLFFTDLKLIFGMDQISNFQLYFCLTFQLISLVFCSCFRTYWKQLSCSSLQIATIWVQSARNCVRNCYAAIRVSSFGSIIQVFI